MRQQVPGYAASEDHSSLRMFSVATGGSGSGRKAPAAEGRFCSPPEPGASASNEPTTWIGYEHPDRLRTSGYLNNLSGYMVPIQMRGSYPDAWFLSGCVVPIQMRGSYPDAWFLPGCAVPTRMRRSYPDAWFLPECATTHASPPAITWIGDEHPDRLRTSGYLNNLSRCVVPIQMRGSYPDAPFLSGCAVPIRMRRSYPDACTVLSTGRLSTTGCIHRPPSSAFLAADDGTRLHI